MGYCPECEAEIDEEFEDVGEIITCPECGIELEVISIDPVEFDLAPEKDKDDEDWDEDDEWDDDDDDWDEDDDDEDWDDDDEYDDE